MKVKFSVLAIGLFTALCASAQSSVSTYGLVSLGVAHTNDVGGGPLTRVVNGPFQLSRIGFKGTEDLGGGNSAFFVLESGFSADTGAFGQGGRAFGRAAVVGLSSAALGSLWIGRQNDVMTDALCFYEAACQFAGFGTHVGDNDNLFTTFRVNNAIAYKSPVWAGLQVSAQYGMPESATDNKDNREYSASAKYARGDFSIGAAVINVDRPNSATNPSGAVSLDYGFSSPFATSRLSGAAVTRQHADGIGGSYKVLDNGLISALYTRSNFRYADSSTVDIGNTEISFSKFVAPAVQAGVGYFVTKARYSNGLEDQSWHQLNLGVSYFLSKRTDVSAVYIHQKAYGAGNKAWIYSEGQSSQSSQTSVGIGIRHRF